MRVALEAVIGFANRLTGEGLAKAGVAVAKGGSVGETGVMRVLQRTCQVMKDLGTDNPEAVRAAGAIELPTLQKFVNFHYSVSVDLFGGEISTNGANFFTSGLKGRYLESRIKDDHQLSEATWPVYTVDGSQLIAREQPALLAVN